MATLTITSDSTTLLKAIQNMLTVTTNPNIISVELKEDFNIHYFNIHTNKNFDYTQIINTLKMYAPLTSDHILEIHNTKRIIPMIKLIRNHTGLGLKKSKDFAESMIIN
jgi:ribosomal protein L7/L12